MISSSQASYSQVAEDILLDYYMGFPKQVGAYIDVGCCWPEKYSNTFRFYKRGWSGICIDANPDMTALFKAARPNDRVVNVGVGKEPGALKYHRFVNPVFNTFSEDSVSKVLSKSGAGRCLLGTADVNIKTLGMIVVENADKLGEAATAPDFMSIDVEGMEFDVLSGMDFNSCAPKVIVIELFAHDVDRLNKHPAVSLLKGVGYELVGFTGHDCYFKKIRRSPGQ